jgi:hypothetical protein
MHWIRTFSTWLVIITAESVHGILRSTLLVPVVGDLHARQIGVAIGSLLILVIAYLFSPWLQVRAPRALLGIGMLWVVLTVLFEVALGRLILGAPWQRIVADYDVTSGGYMLFGLVLLALSPLLAERLRAITRASQHGAA